MNYRSIELEIKNHIATIWLNRPGIYNAFDNLVFKELIEAFREVNKSSKIYIVILRGRGEAFSSGADLNWMMQSGKLKLKKSRIDSNVISKCLDTFYNLSKPTIVAAHKFVFGGALGFLCAADIAICSKNTVLSLSETRLGLAPAVILPYILTRINEHKASMLIYTGKKFSSLEAFQYGMIDFLPEDNKMEETLQDIIQDILKSSSKALNESKKLIRMISPFIQKKIIEKTIDSITKLKRSKDGQEGMRAFLEKRPPKWIFES